MGGAFSLFVPFLFASPSGRRNHRNRRTTTARGPRDDDDDEDDNGAQKQRGHLCQSGTTRNFIAPRFPRPLVHQRFPPRSATLPRVPTTCPLGASGESSEPEVAVSPRAGAVRVAYDLCASPASVPRRARMHYSRDPLAARARYEGGRLWREAIITAPFLCPRYKILYLLCDTDTFLRPVKRTLCPVRIYFSICLRYRLNFSWTCLLLFYKGKLVFNKLHSIILYATAHTNWKCNVFEYIFFFV